MRTYAAMRRNDRCVENTGAVLDALGSTLGGPHPWWLPESLDDKASTFTPRFAKSPAPMCPRVQVLPR